MNILYPHQIKELKIVLEYLWPNLYYQVNEEEIIHVLSRVSLATGVTASEDLTYWCGCASGCDQIWVRIPHVHAHSIVLPPYTLSPHSSSSAYSSDDKSVIHMTPQHPVSYSKQVWSGTWSKQKNEGLGFDTNPNGQQQRK